MVCCQVGGVIWRLFVPEYSPVLTVLKVLTPVLTREYFGDIAPWQQVHTSGNGSDSGSSGKQLFLARGVQ